MSRRRNMTLGRWLWIESVSVIVYQLAHALGEVLVNVLRGRRQ